MFDPFLPPLNDQGNATYKYYTSCISLSASCVICAMYDVCWCWMNKHHTIPYHVLYLSLSVALTLYPSFPFSISLSFSSSLFLSLVLSPFPSRALFPSLNFLSRTPSLSSNTTPTCLMYKHDKLLKAAITVCMFIMCFDRVLPWPVWTGLWV